MISAVFFNMLSIKNISAGYTEPVLKSINIDIKAGEFVGLLGPNGCGKTTLIRTLTRSLKPIAGEVYLDEKNIHSLSANSFAREIALVGQDVWYPFDYTAMEVVLMGRYVYLKRFAQESEQDIQTAKNALEKVGLLNMADRFITTLSGGERQRVMIAKAIAQQPRILLLDEPTSHLDINHAVEIMDMIQKLNEEEHLTVLSVTHDINLASKYCNRIILLREKGVFADGRCEDVVTEENIAAVFGVTVKTMTNPLTGKRCVLF